jgi:hypothetical protein
VARRRAAGPTADEHETIVSEYRKRLTAPAVLPAREWEPVAIGATWQLTPDGFWALPQHTLGWEVLGWCGRWLQHGRGRPWRFTDEQSRFILWWYALDADGRFVFRDGVLQRLKGWGKDPVGACLCAVEMLGPCRFAEWGPDGQPLATDCPEAWVQTAAVSLEQTKNTMRLFPSLFTAEARTRYRLQIGKEVVHGLGDERLIQAVTSAPATLEGARATFVLPNETQHWDASNQGHEMADVIDRNLTKSPDGSARSLRITNAYEPGGDSVAQRDREAYEAMVAGRTAMTGLLYDSLEAPPEAPLSADAAPGVVESIRGDSVWLDTSRIVMFILDPRNSPSTSRRFWYNQITATEDAWVAPQEWDADADPTVVVPEKAIVTLGFDGSKSDDHCALIGCLVEADHLFEIGVWFPDRHTNEVNRADIDREVREAFATYDVVGFYSDLHPWESYVDAWAEDFAEDLCVKASPRQAVAWDIRARGQQFTSAIERLHDAIVESAVEATEAAAENRDPRPRLTHCGSQRFRQHVHNARRAPNPWGISVRKEHRESARKIDSVPAATLARLARLEYLALPESRRRRRKRSGRVW